MGTNDEIKANSYTYSPASDVNIEESCFFLCRVNNSSTTIYIFVIKQKYIKSTQS